MLRSAGPRDIWKEKVIFSRLPWLTSSYSKRIKTNQKDQSETRLALICLRRIHQIRNHSLSRDGTRAQGRRLPGISVEVTLQLNKLYGNSRSDVLLRAIGALHAECMVSDIGLGGIFHIDNPSSFPPTKTFSYYYHLSVAWSFSFSDPSPTTIATPSVNRSHSENTAYNIVVEPPIFRNLALATSCRLRRDKYHAKCFRLGGP